MFGLLLRVMGNQQFDYRSRPLYITILDNKMLEKNLTASDVVNTPTYETYKSIEVLNRLLITTPTLQLSNVPYTLTFSTVLDRSMLKFYDFTNQGEEGLVCLLDGYQKCILAVTTIEPSVLRELNNNPSYQAVIEWTIELTSDVPTQINPQEGN